MVNNQGIWLVVVEEGSWYFVHCCGMWSEGNQEKNTTIIRVRRGFQNLKENI